MYRDAVEYRPGHWLAPGSEALELYKAKKWKELEALLKQTDAAWRKLEVCWTLLSRMKTHPHRTGYYQALTN